MNKFNIRGAFARFLKNVNPAMLKNAVLDFIYPENLYCACCHDAIDPRTRIYGLCDKCAEKFNWTSENPFRFSMDEFSFDDLLCCCIYGYYPRQLIHSLKLGGKRYLAKPIARLMAERFLMSYEPSDFDCISYIPSAKEKQKRRGFNQTELLAKQIAGLLDMCCMPLLIKPLDKSSMRMAGRNERMNLIEGAFKVPESIANSMPHRILLIDDVLTTGATASEASGQLKNAGAEKVCVLVFASSNGNREYTNDGN